MTKSHFWAVIFTVCGGGIAGSLLANSPVLKVLIPAFAVVLFVVYILTYNYFAVRRSMLELAEQPYTIEWLSRVGEIATAPALLTAHSELEDLGYHHFGDYRPRAAEKNQIVACYVHRSEPIYGQISVIDVPTIRVYVALVSHFEGGGELETTGIPWSGSMSHMRPETPYLIQLRPNGAAGALHGQHIGTLHAWIAGGRKPLPATLEAFEGYERQRVDLICEHLKRSGGLRVGEFLRMITGPNAGSVLRF